MCDFFGSVFRSIAENRTIGEIGIIARRGAIIPNEKGLFLTKKPLRRMVGGEGLEPPTTWV
jgi:hypothetical protein